MDRDNRLLASCIACHCAMQKARLKSDGYTCRTVRRRLADAGSNPASSTIKRKTNPSGLAFFCLLPRVCAGSCGLRRAPFSTVTAGVYSPFAYSLPDPPTPKQAEVRKARPSPLYKSRGYARTNQSVFMALGSGWERKAHRCLRGIGIRLGWMHHIRMRYGRTYCQTRQ